MWPLSAFSNFVIMKCQFSLVCVGKCVKFHLRISSGYLDNGKTSYATFLLQSRFYTRGSPGPGVMEAFSRCQRKALKGTGMGSGPSNLEGPCCQPIRRFGKSHKVLLDLRTVVREQLFTGHLFSLAVLSAASVVRRTVIMRTGSYLSSSQLATGRRVRDSGLPSTGYVYYLQWRFCQIAVLMEVHPGTEGRTIKERHFHQTISCRSAAVS